MTDKQPEMAPEVASGRDSKGRILPGMRPVGRSKGTPNKISSLRSEFVKVYHENNGVERLKELLENDSVSFFRLMVAMVPKMKVQENRDFSQVEDFAEIPTSELLKALGLTEVEEAQVEDSGGSEQ